MIQCRRKRMHGHSVATRGGMCAALSYLKVLTRRGLAEVVHTVIKLDGSLPVSCDHWRTGRHPTTAHEGMSWGRQCTARGPQGHEQMPRGRDERLPIVWLDRPAAGACVVLDASTLSVACDRCFWGHPIPENLTAAVAVRLSSSNRQPLVCRNHTGGNQVFKCLWVYVKLDRLPETNWQQTLQIPGR